MDLVDWFHRVLFVGKAFGFHGRVRLVGFAAGGNLLMAGGAVVDEARLPRDVRRINAQSLLRALDADSLGSRLHYAPIVLFIPHVQICVFVFDEWS